MEEKSHPKYSRETNGRRRHCCHVHNICTTSPIHECDEDAARLQAKMLHEILAIRCVCALDDRGLSACRGLSPCRGLSACRGLSSLGSASAARFLHPILGFMRGRDDDDVSALCGGLGCPLDLLHGLLESAHRWHQLVMVMPWLQNLLEVSHSFRMPRPQEVCVSCRKCQALGSEVGMSVRNPKRPRRWSPSRKLQSCHPNLHFLSESQSHDYRAADMDLPERKACQLGQEEGPFASIQRLKSSLKMDLEKHRIYLSHIESRLSSLERRAEDVTRHLEKANLDLEDLKRGSVTLQTLVNQPTSPVSEDLEDWDLQILDSLIDDVLWSGDPFQTQTVGCDQILRPVDPHRTGDLGRPTAGRSREQYNDVEAGISQCQDQINLLLHQISQQIDQTEIDLKMAINEAYRGGGRMMTNE